MPPADELHRHYTVIFQDPVHVCGYFILAVARKSERDGIVQPEGVIVIIQPVGKSHADITDGKVGIADRHTVRIRKMVVFFRHQGKPRPFKQRRIDLESGPVSGVDLPFAADGHSDLYGHVRIGHKCPQRLLGSEIGSCNIIILIE